MRVPAARRRAMRIMPPSRGGAIALAALLIASCGDRAPSAIAYSGADCGRRALIDPQGDIVVGAEDLLVDRRNGRLIVSAYDRRAAERAARRGDGAIPEGGVYAVRLDDLFAKGAEVEAASLLDRAAARRGLRPHGIDYDPEEERLVFINRGYERDNGRWTRKVELIEVYLADEKPDFTIADSHCAANDALLGETTLLTIDHRDCDGGAILENVFRLRRSGLATSEGERLSPGVAFANGLARIGDEIAMGATRENAVLFLDADDGFSERARVKTPGGPDNLTATPDGAIIAAVHPSLLRLAFHRKLNARRAPSRIVRIDPDGPRLDWLFDDPHGHLFSGATVATETEDGLIIGSATDAGLLVCLRPA